MCALPPIYSYDEFSQDANQIFEHWRILRTQKISIDELIQRFRKLFIDGIDYPEQSVLRALHRIVISDWAETTETKGLPYAINSPLTFNGILNRCFYILINYWWLHTRVKQTPVDTGLAGAGVAEPGVSIRATAKLINSIKTDSLLPAPTYPTQRLRQLVQKFRQTEEYEALQDRGNLDSGTEPIHNPAKSQRPLRRLVYRYPYLYPHFFSHCDSDSGFDAINWQQQQQQQLFEERLNTYLTYLIRHKGQPGRPSESEGGINPTELTEEQLRRTVKQFIGPVEGSWTYKQVAQQRIQKISRAASCQEMKLHLHSYITSTFQFSDHPKAATYNQSSLFSNRLEGYLQNILPDERYAKPSPHRLVRTCGEVINYLLVDPNDPKCGSFHVDFLSLHGILGSAFTISLLLKITLLFQDVKNHAEEIHRLVARRFAKLLKHYGSKMSNDESVWWLLDCLEHWQIAFSLHFGQTDFSNLSKWAKHL